MLAVTSAVRPQLGNPVALVALGKLPQRAGVLVPKAAMNEDHRSVLWEDDVGNARQIPAMQPKPITEPVQRASNPNLRLGVRLSDSAHDAAAHILAIDVGHVD